MAKRGPAPRDPADLRQHRYCVYLTDAERATLIERAVPGDADALSEQSIRRYIGRYLREMALDSRPPTIPAVNREAWASLGRTLANLNQYQAAINQGTATGYPPDVIRDLANQVAELRTMLLTGRHRGEE